MARLDNRADGGDGCRHGVQLVVAASRVFGNDWDGSVTAYAEDDSKGRSCSMPCGCTDVAWVGPAADHVAVACDDGNVVVLALASMGSEGWQPAHVLADHDNIVTSVAASPLAKEVFASSSLDHTIKVWSLSAAASGSTSESLCMFRGESLFFPVPRNLSTTQGC